MRCGAPFKPDFGLSGDFLSPSLVTPGELAPTFDLAAATKKRVPHFSRPLREVGTTQLAAPVPDSAEISLPKPHRLYPSPVPIRCGAPFKPGVGLSGDFLSPSLVTPGELAPAFDLAAATKKRVPHFSRPLREVGMMQLAAPVLDSVPMRCGAPFKPDFGLSGDFAPPIRIDDELRPVETKHPGRARLQSCRKSRMTCRPVARCIT